MERRIIQTRSLQPICDDMFPCPYVTTDMNLAGFRKSALIAFSFPGSTALSRQLVTFIDIASRTQSLTVLQYRPSTLRKGDDMIRMKRTAKWLFANRTPVTGHDA